MGRVTQFVNYINKKNAPTKEEELVIYTHIELTEKIKDVRKKYRRVK